MLFFAPLSQSSTITVDLPTRPDSTPTYVVYSSSGGLLKSSASVTLDSVDTTLNGAVSAGSSVVVVTSASGVTVGRKYFIGGNEEAGGEQVIVRSISGTSVTLTLPLRYARASGVAFQSSRVSCSIPSTYVTSVQQNCRIEITWAVSTVDQPKFIIPFHVTKFTPVSTLTVADICAVDPGFLKRLPTGTLAQSLINSAWEMLLVRVAQKKDFGALAGYLNLTNAHGYLVRELVAETAGDEWIETRNMLQSRFKDEFNSALSAAMIDDDQDGAVAKNEGWRQSIVLERA